MKTSPPRRSTILIRLVVEVLLIGAVGQAIASAAVLRWGEIGAPWLRILATIAWALALAGPLIYLRCKAATRRLVSIQTHATTPVRPGGRALRTAVSGAIAVQVLGAGLTAGIVEWQRESVQARARLLFSRHTDQLVREIEQRFQSPLNALSAVRAAHAARGLLDRRALRSFAASYDQEHEGLIRGIGIIERVPRVELEAFVGRNRADTGHAFAVRSTGTHDPLYVIKAIEPIARNRLAWGFDVGQEPRRRQAAEAAIDSGAAHLTRMIRLVQDERQTPGFLLYLPAYDTPMPPGDVPTRRATLTGLFYTPIVARELLAGVSRPLGGDLEFGLFDGDDAAGETLIFDDDTRLDAPVGPTSDAAWTGRFAFERRHFSIAGRPFVLRARSTPAFEKAIDFSTVWLAAIGGAMATMLAAFAAWSLGVGRVRAENRARDMTADLEASLRGTQALLRTIHAHAIVSVTDWRGVIVEVNDAFCDISGYTRDELIGHTHAVVNSGVHDEAYWQDLWGTIKRGAPWRGRICNRTKSGQPYWVDSMIAPFVGADGRIEKYVSIRVDVTASVQDREALAHERRRLNQILEGTDVGTWEWNVQTGVILFNERWAEMVGYTLAELGPTSIDTWGRFTQVDDLRASDAALAQHFDGLTPHYEAEVRLRHKDGHWVWVLARGKLFTRGDDGRPLWMAGTHMDITQRKTADAALQASQALLDRVGRIASVGGWSLEFASREVHVSAEVEQLLGLGRTPTPTLPQMLDALGASAGRSMAAALDAAERHGTGWDVEWSAERVDGSTWWLRSIGEVGVDDRGRPVRVVGTLQDVTARRDLQNELSRKNVLFESVLDNLPFGLAVFDADLRLVTSNRRFGKLLDLPDELANGPGATMEALVRFNVARGEYGEGDPDAVTARVMTRLGSNRGSMTHERIRPDGTPLEIRRAPMPGGGHIDTFTDVSERKRIEARIERSEALLRGALEAVDEAFVVYDPDDRLVLCNDKYRALYETSAPAIVPGATFESILRYGAERGQYRNAIDRVDAWVAERLVAHRGTRAPFVQMLDNGRIVRVIERRMADGHIVGFRIDVTDLERARIAAEEASQAKSRFVANMSHEIRTPMNAVLGMLTLLRRSTLNPTQADHAAKAEGAARALLGLLDDVLDFSKIEAGKLALEVRPFSRDAWLQSLSLLLSASATGKPVDVLFDIDPALPALITADELRLRQVLVNLAGNALKFTAQGEVVVVMRVTAREGPRVRIEVTVSDTGVGIAPEHQQRVFDAFTQAEASTTRRYGGTGLGVAISQRLVAAMGGRLDLRSELGVGTTWTFAIEVSDATPEVVGPSQPAEPVRVLVIDRNEMARRVFKQAARALGWTVTATGDAQEAEQLLRTEPLDAVFCDMRVCDASADGAPAHRMPRSCGALMDHTVFIRLVVSVLDEATAASLADWDAVVAKPFSAAMLAEALARARLARSGLGNEGAARDAREPPTRLAGLRVLVVEDNPTNREIARELLGAEGARVSLAENGALAVDALTATPDAFDVVLMDLQMPVMDGLTATGAIRTMPALAALPVIAMTANAMSSDREACLAAGMNDHVGKPFDLDDLVAVILRHTVRDRGPLESAARAEAPTDVVAERADVLGVADALARFGGRRPTLLRALRAFTTDLAATPAHFAALLEAGQRAAAARLMHTHKGLAATLGADALAHQAARIEKQVQAGTTSATEMAAAWARAVARAQEALAKADADLARDLPPELPPADRGLQEAEGLGGPPDLRPALEHLAVALRARDIRADAALDVLRALAGEGARAWLEPLARALDRFDFDTALDQAERWRAALDETRPTSPSELGKAPSNPVFSDIPANDGLPE